MCDLTKLNKYKLNAASMQDVKLQTFIQNKSFYFYCSTCLINEDKVSCWLQSSEILACMLCILKISLSNNIIHLKQS